MRERFSEYADRYRDPTSRKKISFGRNLTLNDEYVIKEFDRSRLRDFGASQLNFLNTKLEFKMLARFQLIS